MPRDTADVFCRDTNDLEDLVKRILDGELSNVEEGKKWYEVIVGKTPTKASENIWKAIDSILNKK